MVILVYISWDWKTNYISILFAPIAIIWLTVGRYIDNDLIYVISYYFLYNQPENQHELANRDGGSSFGQAVV